MNEVTETIESKGDLFVKKHGEVPCRNPARIPVMLDLVRAVWAQEANTDMRMGQLLVNAARMGGWANDDIWNCEEEVFAAGLVKMLKMDAEDAQG